MNTSDFAVRCPNCWEPLGERESVQCEQVIESAVRGERRYLSAYNCPCGGLVTVSCQRRT